jgi:hypothetical protein
MTAAHLPLVRTEIDPREALREQLAAAVEAANATTDPDERVELLREIAGLRELLGIAPRR